MRHSKRDVHVNLSYHTAQSLLFSSYRLYGSQSLISGNVVCTLTSEIYLWERWDHNNPSDEQMKTIFHDYVLLGYVGRRVSHAPYVHLADVEVALSSSNDTNLEGQPYHERHSDNFWHKSTATSDQKSLVERVRTPDERWIAHVMVEYDKRSPWLRTSYEGRDLADEDFADSLDAMLMDRWDPEGDLENSEIFLDDEALYNFGDDWTPVLGILPEVVDSDGWWESIEEREEETGLCVTRPLGPADGHEPENHNVEQHYLWVAGYVFWQDATATDTGEIAFLWLDEIGRIIRKARISPDDFEDGAGLFDRYSGSETEWWLNAEVGEAYKWGNCPPIPGVAAHYPLPESPDEDGEAPDQVRRGLAGTPLKQSP